MRQRYSGCKIQLVETSREATYSYVVRRTRGKAAPAAKRKKAAKRKGAKKKR